MNRNLLNYNGLSSGRPNIALTKLFTVELANIFTSCKLFYAYNKCDRTRQGYARKRILKLAGLFFIGIQ